MDWAYVLVIILGVLFAFFLVIAIILIVLILKISRQIKSTVASAERTVHSIGGSVSAFNKVALPAMIAKNLAGQFSKRTKSRGKKQESKED